MPSDRKGMGICHLTVYFLLEPMVLPENNFNLMDQVLLISKLWGKI